MGRTREYPGCFAPGDSKIEDSGISNKVSENQTLWQELAWKMPSTDHRATRPAAQLPTVFQEDRHGQESVDSAA